MMQIKPKILQKRKPKMTYITGVKSTVNPILNVHYHCSMSSNMSK